MGYTRLSDYHITKCGNDPIKIGHRLGQRQTISEVPIDGILRVSHVHEATLSHSAACKAPIFDPLLDKPGHTAGSTMQKHQSTWHHRGIPIRHTENGQDSLLAYLRNLWPRDMHHSTQVQSLLATQRALLGSAVGTMETWNKRESLPTNCLQRFRTFPANRSHVVTLVQSSSSWSRCGGSY